MKTKLLVLTGFLVLMFACKKDGNQESYYSIPNVPVNISLNLNEPKSYPLGTFGGWIYVDGGSRGIIVYRAAEEYIAYERHTPYESDRDCARVSVDSTNLYAVDDCGSSKFLLLDGSVAEGEASLPLKRYNTSVFSDVLTISN
jgi:nitrite reductase/ring-hydroxylating ferredoxin subunit